MENLSSVKTQSWLAWFLRGILILGFIILFGRLFELQVIKGNYFRNLSEGNRIRRVVISAPRGQILARGGEVLVGNKEVKRRITFNPQEGYEISDDINKATGDEIITEWIRDYKLKESFAHISGYLGLVSEDEMGKIDPNCPEKGIRGSDSYVGRSGLEEKYNCQLSGKDGEELIEVDTTGGKVRSLGKREPVPGKDIKTSIDYSLQEKVSTVMGGKPGAIVISDRQGEILALYSSPSYDPNIFLNDKYSKEIAGLLNNKGLPLFNRAIGGLYHPGSVFKTIVAIAGLEEKVIDKNYVYDDPGIIIINDFSYSNWYYTQSRGKEGVIGIVRAIGRSTDTFFYKLGEMLGIEKIDKWAEKFGLNSKTNIDLVGEIGGLVPSPEWKLKTKNENWFLGNTYHVSIGQGDLALTPLLINTVVATIANDGKLCSPRIGEKPKCRDLGISKETLDLVKEGMIAACSLGGTGFPFFDSDPQVACKTGTAETSEENITHAWFTFFAPAAFEKDTTDEKLKPDIIVTVLVEKGGEGSSVAGPIAKNIFDYWFGKQK